MIFKIFATIVAFIMGLLGLHQQLPQPTTPTTQVTRTAQPEASGKPAQPTSTSATSAPATSTPIPPRPPLMALSDLPSGLHQATDAEMQKLTTHRWVSTSPLIFRVNNYAEIDFTTNHDTNSPRRAFSGGTKCCAVQGTVLVARNTISIVSWGDSTKSACDPQVLAVEDTEFREFLDHSTVYFNSDGSSMYLKRSSDGAVNEWKLTDNQHVR
ncbi:MAG: META domain-containing protein [Corynebacterium matruchotii]|jgi:hypothetical protein|uniref:META domain-containing protein n=1 Tax=Corynebacterium matruchotii TaxID=43768 RepID=UPI000F6C59EB|nr:META domain-containing protein [Corynebacterium matruchotii]VEI98682.1 Uncharacterised protein [Corynebacterium matruchotii]